MLQEFAGGDKEALDGLIPLVYAELRRLAGHYLRQERSGHTLQPTALVNEVYVRLIRQDQPDYRSRSHFLGVAAQVMRHILIDHARARKSGKRGGGQAIYALDAVTEVVSKPREVIIVAVDDALRALERMDPRKAKLIELRFFGGLNAEESAAFLDLPVDKVNCALLKPGYRENSTG
jgi:RNA polymerase sigma factor (TIGR02999 family)